MNAQEYRKLIEQRFDEAEGDLSDHIRLLTLTNEELELVMPIQAPGKMALDADDDYTIMTESEDEPPCDTGNCFKNSKSRNKGSKNSSNGYREPYRKTKSGYRVYADQDTPMPDANPQPPPQPGQQSQGNSGSNPQPPPRNQSQGNPNRPAGSSSTTDGASSRPSGSQRRHQRQPDSYHRGSESINTAFYSRGHSSWGDGLRRPGITRTDTSATYNNYYTDAMYGEEYSTYPHKGTPGRPDVLIIDCVRDREEYIRRWVSGRQVDYIRANKDIKPIEVVTALEGFMDGIARDCLGAANEEQREALFCNTLAIDKMGKPIPNAQGNLQMEPITDGYEVIAKVGDWLMTEFSGTNLTQAKAYAIDERSEYAKKQVEKIQLCDLCYFESYACEFEKFYYQIKMSERNPYSDFFWKKLPQPFGQKTWEAFSARIDKVRYSETLGGAIKWVKEELKERCEKRKFTMQIDKYANQQCCDMFKKDDAHQWGCVPDGTRRMPTRRRHRRQRRGDRVTAFRSTRRGRMPHNRRHRRRKRYTFPKYRFRRRRRQNYRPAYRKHYTRRRGKAGGSKKGPSSTASSAPKSCRCWVCNEQGHYANECPNKTKHRAEAKSLEYICSLGYFPIENIDYELSDNESIYGAETDGEESDYYSEEEYSDESEEEEYTDDESEYSDDSEVDN